MNNLDPLWLQSFVAIADTGALARAAGRVNRTASALSVQLRQLESTVNARLVERTTRSLRLTAEGERFLPYARRLLDLQQSAFDSVRPSREDVVWRIGFTEYFVPSRLDALLSLLQREASGARIEVAWGRSAELQREWQAERLDLAVVTAAQPPRDGALLRREPVHWVAAPAFHPSPARPLPLVLLADACPVRELALAALERKARAHELRLLCTGSQAAVTAIRAGWGVGCLNESAIPADLELLSRREGRKWQSPGRLAFYLLTRPGVRELARKLTDWGRAGAG